MTPEEKDTLLYNFKAVLEQLTPQIQKEITEWQATYDTMLASIDKMDSSLKAQLMIPALQVLDIIEDRRGRLTPLTKMIAYIEANDASDLTPEKIKASGERDN